jgi:hypothetical protein
MRSGRFERLMPALALAAAAACGGGGGGGAGGVDAGDNGNGNGNGNAEGLVSIALEPANPSLTIDNDTPATAEFRAIGTYEDGSERDITRSARFSIVDSSLGRMEGPAFTSFTTRGGSTRVTAALGGVSGSTNLSLILRKRYVDPDSADDLPDDPGDAFAGDEDAERAPQLVYPNDGVLVPPNLRDIEIHFLPGEDNELFELSFTNTFTDIVLYLRCTFELNGGCIYQPDATLWTWLAQTNRGAEPVQISLRATDDEGTAVGVSESIEMRVSFDDVRGAIYYWTTSGDTAIMRYDFGDSDQQEAEVFMRPEFDDNQTCVGCHALSPDGSKMVAELGGQNDGRLVLFDVFEQELIVPVTERRQSIFQSWKPDGSEFVGVYMDNNATDFNLLLFDGDTAEFTGTIDIGATADDPANHPDWSPDGSRIVFTRVGEANTNQRSYYGAIQMITYEGDDEWSVPETLVPREDGTNFYYPAFSPDPDYIIFNRSRCNSGNTGSECDGDMNPTATLMMMRSEVGATPVELTRANAPGVRDEGRTALYNSFPKWSPFVFQRTEEFGTRLMWVTFSSKRDFGLRETDTLLWMAAIDPDPVRSGLDPSFPAFAIPYQDLETNNHIAQWTQSPIVID